MSLLTDEETKLLLNLAFSGIHCGCSSKAMEIFTNLLTVNPNLESAQYGQAYCYMASDMFEQCDAILQALVAKENGALKDESYALLAFSAALQANNSKVDEYAAQVSMENEAAYNMVKASFEILQA